MPRRRTPAGGIASDWSAGGDERSEDQRAVRDPAARIRPAREHDAAAIAAIYAPIVRASHVTFETEPPAERELRRRIREAEGRYPWLVHEEEGWVTGYGFATAFRSRPAYRWTAEASIYVDPPCRGRGVGGRLGRSLLEALESAGYRSAIGVVALPNPASEALLTALGFRRVGVLRSAGFKLERWWDVELWQKDLGAGERAV
ncbi:MAG: GNAT family N-acetyltransferase [Gemmatimonadetes bacterium]|nr:GNAT family N-acetyltransferase [Gemmatimonadota bacterium]